MNSAGIEAADKFFIEKFFLTVYNIMTDGQI